MTERIAAPASGFEGREDDLGKAVALAIRTLKDGIPYQHEMNDALVKMHLNSLQFAKDQGLTAEYVAHDIALMRPTLARIRASLAAGGDPELALEAIFDRNAALYQLCLDLHAEPGRRSFTFPFTRVLDIARRIGQFDLTRDEVHDSWLKPRILGYAQALGVEVTVSPIGTDGQVTVALVQ
jgi:hypothetical protein